MSDAIIIMFDLTKQESFDDVGKWLTSIKGLTSKQPEIFLIGSKADLVKTRVVAKRLAIQYARQSKMHFQEISVTDLKGVDELLGKITSYVVRKRTGAPAPEAQEVHAPEKACASCMLI